MHFLQYDIRGELIPDYELIRPVRYNQQIQ